MFNHLASRGKLVAPLSRSRILFAPRPVVTIADVKTNVIVRSPATKSQIGFRSYLQQELARRCAANPQYSLRSFALHLETDHSSLSQILRGKRALTSKAIERFGERLKLSRKAIQQYIDYEQSRPKTDRLRGVRQLARDTASMISDLHHFAILELIRLKDFRPDSRWIGRVLGITTDEVNVALSRLIRLDLLEMTEPGKWTDKSGDAISSVEEFANLAVQRLAEQVKRVSSSDDYRYHSSSTVAVNTAKIDSVLGLFRKFEHELSEYLSTIDEPDDIYQIELSLFPITNLKNTKEQ